MARRESAGILLYRIRGDTAEFLLVHPGGPLWSRRDEGAWSIPKGELGPDEDPIETAFREFREETGATLDGPSHPLPSVRQKSGKVVTAFLVEGDFDPAELHSNTFEIEWPPKSKRVSSFPEVDRAEWFEPEEAIRKINPAQASLIIEAMKYLARRKG